MRFSFGDTPTTNVTKIPLEVEGITGPARCNKESPDCGDALYSTPQMIESFVVHRRYLLSVTVDRITLAPEWSF
jgi:hypothetical protein